jgi:hypothetical protein
LLTLLKIQPGLSSGNDILTTCGQITLTFHQEKCSFCHRGPYYHMKFHSLEPQTTLYIYALELFLILLMHDMFSFNAYINDRSVTIKADRLRSTRGGMCVES